MQSLLRYRWHGSLCWHRNPALNCKSTKGPLSSREKRLTTSSSTSSCSSTKKKSSSTSTSTSTTNNNAIIAVTNYNTNKINKTTFDQLSSISKVKETFDHSGKNDTMSIIFSYAGLTFMGIAYIMNTDMPDFRLAAVGSLTMSMIAQYRLQQSFLFRWNVLFWGINVAWIVKSHLDAQEVGMTEDMKVVYNLLEDQGNFLSQRQARELFLLLGPKKGQKQTKKRGDCLTSEGVPCKELFFIESGTGVMIKKGYIMGKVEPGDFVNSGDLRNWAVAETTTNTKVTSDNMETSYNDDPNNEASTTTSEPWSHPNYLLCQESIVVDSESMVVWTWDLDDVKKLDQGIKNALLAHMYARTQERLRQAWAKNIQNDEEMARLQHMATGYLLDGIVVAKKEV